MGRTGNQCYVVTPPPTNLLESWRAMNAVTRLNSWAKREQDGWMDGKG